MQIQKFPQLTPIFDSIQRVASWLWQRGWAEWGAGNLSVDVTRIVENIPENEAIIIPSTMVNEQPFRIFLMSRSGSRMRDIMHQPEHGLCLVQAATANSIKALSLNQLNEGIIPTSEYATYLLVQQTMIKHRPPHGCVLHTHPAEMIAFSQLPEMDNELAVNGILTSLLPELSTYLPQGIGFVPCIEPGSLELAVASAGALEKHTVALWQKHGIIATGATLFEAFDAIDLMVKAAKIYFLLHQKD